MCGVERGGRGGWLEGSGADFIKEVHIDDGLTVESGDAGWHGGGSVVWFVVGGWKSIRTVYRNCGKIDDFR